MFALGFLITAAYWPGIISPAMSPRWAALSILAPALLLYRQDLPVPFTGAHFAGCLLVLWAALTVVWSFSPLDSINGLWLFVAIPAICFVLGSQSSSLRPLFIGAGLGLALSSAVAVAQTFGWQGLPQIASPSGLFLNRNFMAEAAALVLIWLIAERVWWLATLVAPAIALTDARGALLALGVGLGLLLWQRPSRLTAGLLACVVALFSHAMLLRGTATMTERIDIWSDASDGLSWFGNGIGSFGVMAHKLQPDGVPAHAHNDVLEILCDLGVVGLGLAALFVSELLGSLNSVRLVLIVFAVEGCFGFPLYLPATLAIAAVVAGAAVRDRTVVRDVARSGRNFGVSRLASAGPGQSKSHVVAG
jgi:O-Antigen ligase